MKCCLQSGKIFSCGRGTPVAWEGPEEESIVNQHKNQCSLTEEKEATAG